MFLLGIVGVIFEVRDDKKEITENKGKKFLIKCLFSFSFAEHFVFFCLSIFLSWSILKKV